MTSLDIAACTSLSNQRRRNRELEKMSCNLFPISTRNSTPNQATLSLNHEKCILIGYIISTCCNNDAAGTLDTRLVRWLLNDGHKNAAVQLRKEGRAEDGHLKTKSVDQIYSLD